LLSLFGADGSVCLDCHRISLSDSANSIFPRHRRSLSDSRQRLAVEPDECSTESPCAGEACAFSDEADRKAGVVEQALGTAHTKRKRHLQRRRVEMFGKKSR